MQVNLTFEYMEEGLPPRCRAARYRRAWASIPAMLREASEDEAPVALIVRRGDGGSKQYRLLGGELYAESELPPCKSYIMADRHTPEGFDFGFAWFKPGTLEAFEPEPWSKDMPQERWGRWGIGQAMEAAWKFGERFAAIGGKLWEKSGEPAYHPVFCLNFASVVVGEACGLAQEHSASEYEALHRRIEEQYAKPGPSWSLKELEDNKIDVLIPKAVATPSRQDKARARGLKRAVAALVDAESEFDRAGLKMPPYLEGALSAACADLEQIVEDAARAQLRGADREPAGHEFVQARKLLFS